MKVNSNNIKISSSSIKIPDEDKTMILKKNIIPYFEKVKNKEKTVTQLDNTLGYSRTWISLLYNRYIKDL